VYVHTIAGSQGCESQDYDLEGCDDEQPGTFGGSCRLHYQTILKMLKARMVTFPHTYQTTRDNTQKIVVLKHSIP